MSSPPSPPPQTRPKMFYGWWIAVVGAVMQMLVGVLMNQ